MENKESHRLISIINEMEKNNEMFPGEFVVDNNDKKIEVLYLNFLSDTIFSINEITSLVKDNIDNVIITRLPLGRLPLGRYNDEVYVLTEYHTFDEIKTHLSENGKVIIYDSKVLHKKEGLVIEYRSKLI